ncbi:hypothetical protein [Ruminiclostridium papyrosolvens]|uniref:HK97 gp10 family phage protein n=1 Tax=Ruminiclostridium papyrosolvens C7 TaxID=1330534 RepID=U4R2T0_9FIRM|nr:hypothetical protein [Ruminiclostridium papyrosolvens]EPR12496.1 hypothetical protein L323_08055 [Ruminiclostridium papyrosolvens C7]
MQSLQIDGISDFDSDLEELLGKLPDKRRDLHERIAKGTKEEVDKQINASGLKDSSGKIKDWQESHVGSGGGYAAVRAEKGETGKNSPGAITNYLENGHRIREPGGNSKTYRPRIKKPYVDGYHFYQSAQTSAEAKAIAEAEKFVEEFRQKLEG